MGELEKLAENGGVGVQRWVCHLYQHAAQKFPSVKGLVSGLEVATLLLAIPGASLVAVQAVDAALAAFYQVPTVPLNPSHVTKLMSMKVSHRNLQFLSRRKQDLPFWPQSVLQNA